MKRFVRKVFFLLTNILFCTLVKAATWIIGPTQIYTLPSQVRTLVQDGDTILIDGGIYLNDATKWTKKDLVFIGLGIEPNRTVLQYSGDIPNGKGIFVLGPRQRRGRAVPTGFALAISARLARASI